MNTAPAASLDRELLERPLGALTVAEFLRIAGALTQHQQAPARREPPPPPTMTLKEAQKALGDVDIKTVRRWCERGRLQWAKIGGRRLVLRASVELALAQNASAP